MAEKIYWKISQRAELKRIVSLDVSTLLSGTRDSGEVNARLVSVLSEAISAGNVILLIDGFERLFMKSDHQAGTVDASEVLSSFLGNTSLRIIRYYHRKYYQTFIEPKTQISSNFEKVLVDPTDQAVTKKILEDVSLFYSSKYKIKINYSAVHEIYRLADRFITTKEFPAKAVDLLDNICSSARNSGAHILTRNMWTILQERYSEFRSVEAEETEKKNLLSLEEKLHERVVGQMKRSKQSRAL